MRKLSVCALLALLCAINPCAINLCAINPCAINPCAINLSAVLPGYTKRGPIGIPTTNFGQIDRYRVNSEILKDSVTVDIWTPSDYNLNDGTYPVVYAFDGQNLFDPEFSFAGVAWELDSISDLLLRRGAICSPIIVGINNRGGRNLRPNDYFPEKALDYIAPEDSANTYIFETCRAGFHGDENAAFVAQELKPLVDRLYRTGTDRVNTVAMGSSMGALAALYLMCEYPDVFGAAACMSTHWIGSLKLGPGYSMTDDPVCARAVLHYFRCHLPDASTHRLHLDMGDLGWDASCVGYERQARAIAAGLGYSEDRGNCQAVWFENSGHNEWFWQQNVSKPLTFLLSARPAGAESVVNGRNSSSDSYYTLNGLKISAKNVGNLPTGIYIHNGSKVLIKGNR